MLNAVIQRPAIEHSLPLLSPEATSGYRKPCCHMWTLGQTAGSWTGRGQVTTLYGQWSGAVLIPGGAEITLFSGLMCGHAHLFYVWLQKILHSWIMATTLWISRPLWAESRAFPRGFSEVAMSHGSTPQMWRMFLRTFGLSKILCISLAMESRFQ